MCGLGKKNNTVICLPKNGMLVTITHNAGHIAFVAEFENMPFIGLMQLNYR